MKYFKFIELFLDFISSISWPLIALIIFLYLKEPLIKILNMLRPKKLSYNNLIIDFTKGLEDVENKIQSRGIASSISGIEPSVYSNILEVAKLSPSSAIILSWKTIESQISRIVRDMAISPDGTSYKSPLRNIQLLTEYTSVDKLTLEIIEQLRKLRDLAVHSNIDTEEITFDEAEKYYYLASSVIPTLQNLKKL